MDTAQAYTQGNTQAGNRGPIANLPLPNLSGQANGVIGKSSTPPSSSSRKPSRPVEDDMSVAPLPPRPPSQHHNPVEPPSPTESESSESQALERIAAQSPPSGAVFDWGLRTGRAKRANVAAQVISSRVPSGPTESSRMRR